MERKWWHGKTAYQIYPKSFCDSNGDGIGDIQGIISKLDYLKELGVDILWLSPIYCSPCADQGYDISDYYRIDPQFGTMEDMDELLAEAKKRDMYILMDLVVNHCSDEHEWFQKAKKDPEGEYGKMFYLQKVTDGKLLCNWRSYFGGPVWDRLEEGSDWYYFHAFHKKQPDLNWENPKLREAVYRMINWWLDKGLAGFRIDAIINIKKVLPFRDYPADRDDGLCSIQRMLADAKGVGEFLGEMRDKSFALHDAFTVGEVFNEKDEELPDFIGDGGYFSTMFDFKGTLLGKSEQGWYASRIPTPDEYRDACFENQKRVQKVGFLANIIENHDEPRGVSHYIPQGDCCDRSKKMLAALYFLLRGLPFLYQGQELGMENTIFSDISEVDDISTLDEYQVALRAGYSPKEALDIVAHYSRDNARTPFQWDGSEKAGFTTGTPWLPLNPNHTKIHAEQQQADAESVYAFYKQLIALRNDEEWKETLVYGELLPILTEEKNLMAYYRKGEKTVLVIGNFQKEARTVKLPCHIQTILLQNLTKEEQKEWEQAQKEGEIHLEGYQVVVAEALQ
ncbi:MAG: alpha-glucosidase [bacterium]|nr:alpha-glucosidase [bacterium]